MSASQSSEEKTIDVFGLGNALLDIETTVTDDEFATMKLKKGGMALTDASGQASLLDQLEHVDLQQHPGGSVANSISTLAKLGSKTGFACSIGEDERGRHYIEQMAELGIQVSAGIRHKTPTGTCLVLVTPDAERTMNTHLGAACMLAHHDLNPAEISQSRWLYIEGYLMTESTTSETALHAMRCARSSGTKIALSLSDAFVVEAFRERIDDALTMTDLVFANQTEAAALTGKDDPKVALQALRAQCPNVALTMSEQGSYLALEGQEPVFVDAVKANAIDATGAGDAYAAGVLHGICTGQSPHECGQLGAAIAAKVVAQYGARVDVQEFR